MMIIIQAITLCVRTKYAMVLAMFPLGPSALYGRFHFSLYIALHTMPCDDDARTI